MTARFAKTFLTLLAFSAAHLGLPGRLSAIEGNASKIQLEDEQFKTIDQAIHKNDGTIVEMKQWFDRIEISGIVNAGFVQTGKDGTQSKGHFYASERLFGTGLFIDAKIAEGIKVHDELFLYNQAIQLKELYIEFEDIGKLGGLLSLKAGRFDIPYGEEYLWQNSIDNPMVLRTAGWPWGFSQGVLLFGHAGAFGWLASVTDGLGNDARDQDDNSDKSYTARLTLDPSFWLHFGASAMKTGQHAQLPIKFSDVVITPLGTTSQLDGASPNTMIDFQAWQGDMTIKLGSLFQLRGDYGMAKVIDGEPWARTFSYYYGEAKCNLTSQLYLVGRYSAIGTFDAKKGYSFGGDYDGAPSFGFDVQYLTRAGGAVGYKINDNLVIKLEVDNDTVKLIEAAEQAGITPGASRVTYAAEIVSRF